MDDVHISPILDTKTTNLAGLQSIVIMGPSKENLHNCWWVLISRSLNQHVSQMLELVQFATKETERYASCEEHSRNQGRPFESTEQQN